MLIKPVADSTFQFPKAADHYRLITTNRDNTVLYQVRYELGIRMRSALQLTCYEAELLDQLWVAVRNRFWVDYTDSSMDSAYRPEYDPIIRQKLDDTLNELRNLGYQVAQENGKLTISCVPRDQQ
jgi:hypothetical protein